MLFHEIYSNYYNAVAEILARAAEGKLTEADLYAVVQRKAFSESVLTIPENLKNGKIGGAALDVYEEESDIFFEDRSSEIINDDTLRILLSMPNVLITSHQAFLTEDALENIAETTVQNIVSFFSGSECPNELCRYASGADQCKSTN